MGRLIDADKLIKKFQSDKEYFDRVGDTTFAMATIGVIHDIEDAPTIEVPKWMPCSERLPEDSGDYLVRPSDNVLDDYSEFEEIMIMPYDADCEAFGWWTSYFDPISLGFVDSEFTDYEVIAWMPLPKPYEETDHERLDR